MSAGLYFLPAVCVDPACQAVFPSWLAMEAGASVETTNVWSGPCPRCGGSGRVPDGLYEFARLAKQAIAEADTIERESVTAAMEALPDDATVDAVATALEGSGRLGKRLRAGIGAVAKTATGSLIARVVWEQIKDFMP